MIDKTDVNREKSILKNHFLHLEKARYALRVTFSYEEMNVQPIACKKIQMLAPPNEIISPAEGQSGFWIELRNADEHVLYAHIRHNPIRYFYDEPGENGVFRTYRIKHPKGLFQVLVPDLADAETLVLTGSPPDAMYKSATEIARYRLHGLLSLNSKL